MARPDTPQPPSKEVEKLLDPDYTPDDFDDALERVTRQQDDPAAPDQESPKTSA